MVEYLHDLAGVTADRLRGGFFEGWAAPPSPEALLAHLRGAEAAILAIEPAHGDAVGFISAVGDGGFVAFIPLLEVLPAWRHQGVGRELVRRMLDCLGDRYSIDLVCDDPLVPFYEGFGGTRLTAVGWRNTEVLR